jgi:hypothetical protein
LKQLYFLHIPKTAGKFVGKCVRDSLSNTDLKIYISTHYPNEFNVFDKAYVSGHFGTYPIEKNPSMDVACLLRNPIDARVSYFNFIYKDQMVGRPEYDNLNSYLDKLKYYLFNDSNYELHNNYQARFICNPANEKSFNLKGFHEDYGNQMMKDIGLDKGKAFTWFVGNDKTSLDLAMNNIMSFKIVNTAERLDLFMSRIDKWFIKNYDQQIHYNLFDRVNTSSTKYDEVVYKTNDLIDMLTTDEKNLILSNNHIDYSLYLYIKEKELMAEGI